MQITPKFGFEKFDLLKDFHVVTMISNPIRFHSRYHIYSDWIAMMQKTGVNVVTVEVAFGGRPFEVTTENNPNHVQLRSENELWIKENALNIGIQHICRQWPNAKYFAWIDADVFPMRRPEDWLLETYHMLQHYHVVQMFELAQDLDAEFNPFGKPQQGFMAAYIKSGYKLPDEKCKWNYYGMGHPGYAHAMTREAFELLGGLIDTAILGAGDRHMTMGLIHAIDFSFPAGITKEYKEALKSWEDRARKHIRLDVGYVKGGIYHYWHGPKRARGYSSRWKILVENKYSPKTDIKRDAQGLYQIEDNDMRQIRLRDQIRSYFNARLEDHLE